MEEVVSKSQTDIYKMTEREFMVRVLEHSIKEEATSLSTHITQLVNLTLN